MEMNKIKNEAMQIMSQLSEEEIHSFLQQDYSTLIKFLELRVELLNKAPQVDDLRTTVIDEIVAMSLESLADFLKDINSIGKE